jgi:hypothetical protein
MSWKTGLLGRLLHGARRRLRPQGPNPGGMQSWKRDFELRGQYGAEADMERAARRKSFRRVAGPDALENAQRREALGGRGALSYDNRADLQEEISDLKDLDHTLRSGGTPDPGARWQTTRTGVLDEQDFFHDHYQDFDALKWTPEERRRYTLEDLAEKRRRLDLYGRGRGGDTTYIKSTNYTQELGDIPTPPFRGREVDPDSILGRAQERDWDLEDDYLHALEDYFPFGPKSSATPEEKMRALAARAELSKAQDIMADAMEVESKNPLVEATKFAAREIQRALRASGQKKIEGEGVSPETADKIMGVLERILRGGPRGGSR